MCHKFLKNNWKTLFLAGLCAVTTLACSPASFARGGGGGGGGGGHGGGGFGGGGHGFGSHGIGGRGLGRGHNGFGNGWGWDGGYGWGGYGGWGDDYTTEVIVPDNSYDKWVRSEDDRRQKLHAEETVHNYTWQ
jgi:hypothetical protein